MSTLTAVAWTLPAARRRRAIGGRVRDVTPFSDRLPWHLQPRNPKFKPALDRLES